MKVLLVASCLYNADAGVAGATLSLARAMRNNGADADVLFYDDIMGSSVKTSIRGIIFPFKLIKLDRLDSYDVVDVASGDLWFLAMFNKLAGRNHRTLLVARSHGLEHVVAEQHRAAARRGETKLSWKYPVYHGGWRLREVAQSLRMADLGLFLNQGDLDFAVSRLKVDPARCEIVPNGLSPTFLKQPLSVVPNAREPLRVAMIGGFFQRKGLAYAIGALRRLLARYSVLEIGFFGVGKDNAPRIEAELGNMGSGRVKIVENYVHEQLPELLQNYHALLFPSLAEGFGMAALEGMACGLALITTSVVGLAERLL
ncbi:MAG: glycosyltransferase family 4 protein, partial [Planctomycetia bacterium]|nr:glycosyltransferase family 4 protein [Planctomycetia bacterium]